MCEFISVVRMGKKDYFLTKKQMGSPQGQAIKLRFPGEGELLGHSAIRAYYEIDGGVELEFTDFSSPDNFPDVLVRAIKRGDFAGIATPIGLLSKPALAEYNKIEQQAWAEYNKIKQSALAEYNKIKQSALAEYNKIKQPALAEYNKIEQQARAEYNKIEQQARAEYNKIEQSAWAEYQKIEQQAFWTLFADNKNRTKAWRD